MNHHTDVLTEPAHQVLTGHVEAAGIARGEAEGSATDGSAGNGSGLARLSVAVLGVVAAVGAVLSWVSLYEAARPTFGPVLAAGFPLLVDALVLGASLRFIVGARVGRPRFGWRLTAHAGVAATIALNALAAPELSDVPWHITAPAVWSVLVELAARDVLGDYKATHHAPADRIPLALWLSAPVESARTALIMMRTGEPCAAQARVAVGVHAAARQALRHALPGRGPREVRSVLARQLRAGSLPPAAVLYAIGWTSDTTPVGGPDDVLRRALTTVLTPSPGESCTDPRPDRGPAGFAPIHSAPTPSIPGDPIHAPAAHGWPGSHTDSWSGSDGPSPVTVTGSPNRPGPARVGSGGRLTEPSATGGRIAPRDRDVRTVLAAIAAGDLPPQPTAKDIRLHLAISPAYARAARDAVRNCHPNPDPTSAPPGPGHPPHGGPRPRPPGSDRPSAPQQRHTEPEHEQPN